MAYYPILVELQDQPVLVLGGGKIAERKVETLEAFGARVRLVAKELTPKLATWSRQGRIQYLGPRFEESLLDNCLLAVVATNDASLNRTVSVLARTKGKLVNVVDQPQHCTFIVPSIVKRGDLVVAISTSGKSPALAKRLREQLEEHLGEELSPFVQLMGCLRERILNLGLPQEKNQAIFEALVDSDLLKAYKKHDLQGIRKILGRILPPEVAWKDLEPKWEPTP